MRNLCMQFAITHIPIITGGLLICTCLISYAWAVSSRHVPAFMPFISDTGTFAPESCFFGQLLNMGSLLIALTVYLRHLQLRDHHSDVYAHFPRFRFLSRFSLFLGLTSALGVSLVANFQEVNQIELHIAGAAMVFGVGAVYMWIETYISYQIHPGGESRAICHLRLVLSVIGLLGFILMHVTIALAFRDYKPLDGRTVVNWIPADGGWEYHTASAICEWITAFVEVMFFVTFSKEFRRFRLAFPKLIILNEGASFESNAIAHPDDEILVPAGYVV
ncbi:hypothetical protein RvY_13978 [Ramazzottius varieornatus]|uniref:CWH43-like N-terminal domain-containing protein n=1 Tax=Ramazzottius varieornatus TaxID=947166 RepID=A0A1D1VPT1_RAMVA|nr:hypothetical protein RvY_13978 [Ramazzottius varieornatus]